MLLLIIRLFVFLCMFGCGSSTTLTNNSPYVYPAANTKAAIDAAVAEAYETGMDIYFPDGIWNYPSAMNAQGVRFYGESKAGTILIGLPSDEHNVDGAENMTFQDFRFTDYGNVSDHRIFRNCAFKSTVSNSGYYLFYQAFYTSGTYFEFTDCDFIYDVIYAGVFLRQYKAVTIKNCTFSGNDAAHAIRLQEPMPGATVEIAGNTITGGATGIFIAGDRIAPIENGVIEGNTLYSQTEESICMDGFGNNAVLCPVICNGPITRAANDTAGRLVISMAGMLYYGTAPNQPSPVSLRSDWTKFYFTFGQGSGQEGVIARIYSYDVAANTLTLDLYTPASAILIGGDSGVQGGFFNWTIRGNTITGALGANGTYATAIAAYLNVFNSTIEDNIVTNSAHGINLAGGLMLSTYYTLAYNNRISNNKFMDCDQIGTGDPSEEVGVVRLLSYYGGHTQYNNQFINNTVTGGRIFIENQGNLTFENNILTNTIIKTVP